MSLAQDRAAALEYRLPGEWWAIAVDGSDAAADSVRRLTRATLGRRDDQATARAEQRRRLTAAAHRAVAAGATQLHVSMRGEHGIAFASMLTEYRPRLPLGARAEPELVADALVRALARTGASRTSGGDHWGDFADEGGSAFGRADGLVLRRSRLVDGPSAAAPALTVDYWLTEPGRADVVLATFTTALVELAPLMTELFDGVIAAAEWRHPTTGARLASRESRTQERRRA